jgi:DNA ligase-1
LAFHSWRDLIDIHERGRVRLRSCSKIDAKLARLLLPCDHARQMKLADLADVSSALAAQPSRSEKTLLLANLLRKLAPDEREVGVAWLAGIVPGGRLNLGPSSVYAAKSTPAAEPTLTLGTVTRALDELRAIAGKGAARRREEALATLFRSATASEQRFLVGLLLGELRQGALEGVMADAIAAAAQVDAAAVRRAMMLAGHVAPVARAALEKGTAGLARFSLTLYRPLAPMLASPTADVVQALATLERAALDFKLDGARVQIHKGPAGVRVFSRTGRDVTASVPELVAAIDPLPARSAILDGEALALAADGRARPFQETMRRFGRKLDIDALQKSLPLTLFCFDCLHADGKDLIDTPLAGRLEALAAVVPAELIVPRIVTSDVEEARRFLADALARGHEGVMVKALDRPYEAGSRGAAWLKVKIAHTLDLVVLAAEWGSGRRQGWLSNLHLGARDPDTGGFVMLGKTFKGLTDEMLDWQTAHLRALATNLDTGGYVVNVRPELVVEIAFNDLQASSRYPGGLALRFARVVRHRPDKRAEDADTIATVRAIATAQRGSTHRTTAVR